MEALLYFAFWAALIFLMMRFGCGRHIMGHGRGSGQGHDGAAPGGGETLRWVAPEKEVDPVCGKTVATATAKPSVFDGSVYYFCSRECRDVFEAAPDIYVGGGTQDDTPRLGHSRV
jgi:YHS domain-containing protein